MDPLNSPDRYADPELDALQENLRSQLDFSPERLFVATRGKRVVTLDVRYLPDGRAQVGIDTVILPDEVLPTQIIFVPVTGRPYIPGYMSFYEGPVVAEALEKLALQHPPPDLVIVDGHGMAHPRKFGLACYVGAITGLPTIGIAKKNLLPFDRKQVPEAKNATFPFLVGEEQVGVAIRLQQGINPVFVSHGNRITLETAIAVIQSLTGSYRLPENLRRADEASRRDC